MLIGELLQHEIAPRENPVGVPARIVVGRPAHHRHEQRDLRQVELGERLAEIELAREAEAVDRAVAVLPEEDLIDIGVHEIVLGEAGVERDRHDRLADLASERLARGEEITAHQLLSERAPSLLNLARARIDPQCAQDRLRIDPAVRVEPAILDRLERGRQQRRNFARREHDAVLAMAREDAADEQRLEADHRHLVPGGVLEGLDPLGAGGDTEQLRVATLVGEACRAQRDIDARPIDAVGARAVELRHLAVMQPLELMADLRLRERQARIQLERRGEHLGRQCPAASLELMDHQQIEIEHVGGTGDRRHRQQAENQAPQRISSTAGSRRL